VDKAVACRLALNERLFRHDSLMDMADRETELRRLAVAEELLALSCARLARQRKFVAELEQGGHDTTEARSLLGTFEMARESHRGRVATLLADLADAGWKLEPR
jgi:hypothetical protein